MEHTQGIENGERRDRQLLRGRTGDEFLSIYVYSLQFSQRVCGRSPFSGVVMQQRCSAGSVHLVAGQHPRLSCTSPCNIFIHLSGAPLLPSSEMLGWNAHVWEGKLWNTAKGFIHDFPKLQTLIHKLSIQFCGLFSFYMLDFVFFGKFFVLGFYIFQGTLTPNFPVFLRGR